MRFTRGSLIALFGAVLVVTLLRTENLLSQVTGSQLATFKARSIESENRGLSEAYKGITADGKVEPGLFPIKSSGVSTDGVRKAAEHFLSVLTAEQRQKSMFPIDDPEWRKWMNQHFYVRQGVSFVEMNENQREAAFSLMKASLSARGLQLSRDIMRLNHTLGEMNNNDFQQYGEWLYHITVMGKPSAKDPWGWQIDGHHLIINYFVLGDQVVMTPTFVGSEPVIATSGKFKGVTILQKEQADGLAFVNALDEKQKAKAILRATKTANDNLTEAFKDNVTIPYAGVKASDLTAAQKQKLLQLTEQFIGNMDDGHAKVKMADIRKHLDATHFAWAGPTDEKAVFYYRIHSPVVLIEFDHQNPAGLRQAMPNQKTPFREHVHVVIRTPNGNDYGKDLLRQHLLAHPHGY
jgi:hypothetical protein